MKIGPKLHLVVTKFCTCIFVDKLKSCTGKSFVKKSKYIWPVRWRLKKSTMAPQTFIGQQLWLSISGIIHGFYFSRVMENMFLDISILVKWCKNKSFVKTLYFLEPTQNSTLHCKWSSVKSWCSYVFCMKMKWKFLKFYMGAMDAWYAIAEQYFHTKD